MLIKNKNKYIITHYEEINKNLTIIKKFFLDRVRLDKILKKVNYEAYEKLEKMIDIKPIDEAYTFKDLLINYNILKNMKNNIEAIPRKISKLEAEGYSISSFGKQETIININMINENIYLINYYIPKLENYLICKSEFAGKIKSDLRQFLIKNKLYDFIVLFELESIAAELREQLAVVPLKLSDNLISMTIQRHGLLPASSYKKMDVKKTDTVLYTGGSIYYDSFNIFKSFSQNKGLSNIILDNEVSPRYTKPVASDMKIGTSGKIYETNDGETFRLLKSRTPANIARGPSHIANGYNIQLSDKINKYLHAPLITSRIHEITKNIGKNKYADIRTQMRYNNKMNKKNIIDNFINYMVDQLDYDTSNKFLKHELNHMIINEKIKLNRKLKMAASIEDFFEDIISDRDNFILNFERKLKIYSR